MMQKKPVLYTFLLCLGVAAFRLLLDINYTQILASIFGYSGFADNRTVGSCILSWLILALSLPIIIHIFCSEKGSSIVVSILYFLSFVPFTSCIHAGLFSLQYIVACTLYWYTILTLQWLNLRLKTTPFPPLRGNKGFLLKAKTAKLVNIFAILIILALSWRYTHFRLNFNLLAVYDLRAEASSYSLSTIMQYLFGWARAVNPFMLAYFLIHRKWGDACVSFAASMLCFGIDGSKTAFFFPVLFALIVFIYQKHKIRKTNGLILLGMNGVAAVGLLEFLSLGSFYISSFLVRRIMFAENLNSYYYYDFFMQNPPDFFRASFLRLLGFRTPYPNLVRLIGNIYHNAETNANCGLFADAVTNCGLWGIVVLPLLFIFVMHLFDKCSCGVKKPLVVCAASYIAVILVNTFLGTALLTHGVIILFLLLYCLQNEELSKKGKAECKIASTSLL